jgi:dTDP-4-amino-4,6-dideoxygalactose transaminase
VEIGSSYLMSELSAAFLFAQFSSVMEVLEKRRQLWFEYYQELLPLANHGKTGLPVVGEMSSINGHLFYLKCKNEDQLKMLSSHLGRHNIESAFHYVPLHNSIAGIKYGRFIFDENWTESESSRLLRLPIYFDLEQISTITKAVNLFFYESSVSH